MTSDDAKLVMLKVRKLRDSFMDSYTHLQSVANPYDKSDPEYRAILESVYDCVSNMDKAGNLISKFVASKARDPEEWHK